MTIIRSAFFSENSKFIQIVRTISLGKRDHEFKSNFFSCIFECRVRSENRLFQRAHILVRQIVWIAWAKTLYEISICRLKLGICYSLPWFPFKDSNLQLQRSGKKPKTREKIQNFAEVWKMYWRICCGRLSSGQSDCRSDFVWATTYKITQNLPSSADP